MTWESTILQEIDSRGEGLTDWEVEFVESITKQLDAGTELSDRQIDILSRIHEERVS